MQEIIEELSKYDNQFGHIIEWRTGSAIDRIRWLCRVAGESSGFKLESEPMRSDYISAINRWYGRRATTNWSDKEKKALKAVLDAHTTDGDFQMLDKYYSAAINPSEDYRRRDVLTLLNNWAGEIDRARKWTSTSGARHHMHVRL